MNWSLLEMVVALFFAAWFVASVLNQLPWQKGSYLKRFDVLAIIPSWSFFAPNPGSTDYFLMARTRTGSEDFGPWTKIPIYEKRIPFCMLWNPAKRPSKAFTDLASELFFLSARYERNSLMFTLPYLLMLEVCASAMKEGHGGHLQFAVVEKFGFYSTAPLRIGFLSQIHKI